MKQIDDLPRQARDKRKETSKEGRVTQEFDAVMACVGSLTNCIPGYRFDEPIANAAELFGGEHRCGNTTFRDLCLVCPEPVLVNWSFSI